MGMPAGRWGANCNTPCLPRRVRAEGIRPCGVHRPGGSGDGDGAEEWAGGREWVFRRVFLQVRGNTKGLVKQNPVGAM